MELINVTKSSLPPLEDYVKEISSIWESHWLTNMGEKHNKLQDEMKEYLKVSEISLFSNGHLALEMAIQALGFEKGEVITTPYTFASTTHAIVRNNLKPVFCDINLNDCTIDVSKIEALITKDTVAILPVHVYGNVCDVEKIDSIAKKHNLKVIYDAAHVFGVEYQNKGVGEYGDMSMFSLHATKVFNSIEGGVITCKDSKYIDLLYNLKNFGIKDAQTVIAVGGNAKMNEFQAAMGLCNLKYLDINIDKRKKLVEQYKKELEKIDGIQILLNFDKNIKSNFAYMPILVDSDVTGFNRDELFEKLKENNIIARKYFYPIVTEFACYKDIFNYENLNGAKYISENVLTLPLYDTLESSDLHRICDIIKKLAFEFNS